MKKLSVALAAIIVVAMGAHAGDTVTSVNVVGYMTASVAGDATEGKYSLVAVPMTKLPVARGVVSGNTATTITDADASWTANAFAVGGTAQNEPGISTYYVEITSGGAGSFEGRHFYIASNTSDTLTLAADPGDLNATDLNGASYKIIAANRVRDVFGEPPDDVALTGGSSSANADSIQLLNPTGWGSPIFYRNAGMGGVQDHWVQDGADADNLVIDRDEGVIVYRLAGGDSVDLTVMGEVSANVQAIPVVPGFSLVNGMSAAGEAIGSTTLTNVLQGGSSSANADTIQAWTGTGWSSPVFYRNDGMGGVQNHWVQDGVDVDQTFILEPTQAYIVIKGGATAGVWARQSPL